MQHTLIAVFDNRADAQSALDELLLSGFSRQSVRMSQEADTAITDETQDGGFEASIKAFFSDVFGSDDNGHSQKYSNAVNKGSHVLTVTAAGEAEAERAADIVDRFGPVDIDDKAASWGGASTAHAESMRMSGAGGMQQSQGLSLQSHGDRNLFAQQSLNDERPMGQTYQESMGPNDELSVGHIGNAQRGLLAGSQQRDTTLGGSIGSSNIGGGMGTPSQADSLREVQRGRVRMFSSPGVDRDDDDSYYRTHWDSNYSGTSKDYDEYAPAYGFGHELANMYRGRPWEDVEYDAKSRWDSRSAGTGVSTWEQFKGAIRHGWNRLTH